MSPKTKVDEDMSFENAIQNLELIVKHLEEGNLTLDEALAKFEEGINLSRVCSRKLEQAEKKIEMLMASEEGELIFKVVDLGEKENG